MDWTKLLLAEPHSQTMLIYSDWLEESGRQDLSKRWKFFASREPCFINRTSAQERWPGSPDEYYKDQFYWFANSNNRQLNCGVYRHALMLGIKPNKARIPKCVFKTVIKLAHGHSVEIATSHLTEEDAMRCLVQGVLNAYK